MLSFFVNQILPLFWNLQYFIILNTFILKIHIYFQNSLSSQVWNACYFDYLMISYWFDIKIFSKIKLHMSQNVVLYLQNIKKWQKSH